MTPSTFFVKLLSLLAFAIPVYSQIGYDENSNTLLCSKPGYESSPTAGDAVCAVNGTGFALSHRTNIAVPETILCDAPSLKENTSLQGILHKKPNNKSQTQPRFTFIPLPPPVTLGYLPAPETVHAEPVASCSDPWERMPDGRARLTACT
ncbi:hypothetical protein BDW42DRAFT_190594 [Aspergillus taichungensis]|uniref:Uncharacterized protein n=1 Tax=Aspergillus taichungensis TaxID=482145 RepID=A0A2J5I7Q5_9EURO|nr:hypothetical protein BDW42DRAFT_190594 [Aspergillus taichungensis]